MENVLGRRSRADLCLSVKYSNVYGYPNASASSRLSMLLTSWMFIDIFGKRNRSFFHRHDILKMLGLD